MGRLGAWTAGSALALLATLLYHHHAHGQTIQPVCTPVVSTPIVVASAVERTAAGRRAIPPLDDPNTFFAWPDTPVSAVRSGEAYVFFGSDGALHRRQEYDGHKVGTNRYGSITATLGTLRAPLGTGTPMDVSIDPNSDASVNPAYASYTYMGGGPVLQVQAGTTGAGKLLAVYHAEIRTDALYAVLGLAASDDGGGHWTDLGEILRLNQAFAPGLDGYEIGDGPLVVSPDGKYFYLYFPDWIADGTTHADIVTNVSVARAPVASVLAGAFATGRRAAVPFEKFYRMSWHLQPGLGGASTDLVAASPVHGYIDVHADPALGRYVMILSDDTTFAYAESSDGLAWTRPVPLGTFGASPALAAYPSAVGLGSDPRVLGKDFYVYFTHLPNDGTGWENATLRRLTLSCP